jgi:hypothetical protein
LKKPRSYSESESGLTTAKSSNHGPKGLERNKSFGGMDSSSSSSGHNSDDLNGSKKSVSFNNQVVRNIFKPGSTVNGMKKPNPNKNKKKNTNKQRKRTVSDPSNDATASCSPNAEAFLLRSRSISDSSDDGSSAAKFANSNYNSNSSESLDPANDPPALKTNRKKKNKKKGKGVAGKNAIANASITSSEAKNHFDMATMLEWKNQERLVEPKIDTKTGLSFDNKLINDLDD